MKIGGTTPCHWSCRSSSAEDRRSGASQEYFLFEAKDDFGGVKHWLEWTIVQIIWLLLRRVRVPDLSVEVVVGADKLIPMNKLLSLVSLVVTMIELVNVLLVDRRQETRVNTH